MRKVLRNADSLTYWNNRWRDLGKDEQLFQNKDIYPIKFIDREMTLGSISLDAGCGLGRLVKHYHNEGFVIEGCDYSEVAVEKLNKQSPELKIRYGNLTDLPYEDDRFDNIFVMGGFHSIESLSDLDKAVKETVRCLKPDGTLIAEARADTLENWLIDHITERRGAKGTRFHKWCFEEKEIKEILKRQPLDILDCERVTNFPFLYKFASLRKKKEFNETLDRSHGYLLNRPGNALKRFFEFIKPSSFFTHFILTAKKKS